MSRMLLHLWEGQNVFWQDELLALPGQSGPIEPWCIGDWRNVVSSLLSHNADTLCVVGVEQQQVTVEDLSESLVRSLERLEEVGVIGPALAQQFFNDDMLSAFYDHRHLLATPRAIAFMARVLPIDSLRLRANEPAYSRWVTQIRQAALESSVAAPSSTPGRSLRL